MLKFTIALGAAAGAAAFSPAALPLRASSGAVACRSTSGLTAAKMQYGSGGYGGDYPEKMNIDGGFGTYDRSQDDWGGGTGTGGASGKIPDAPASFEEYMKQRAAESGGKVLDAAGNDVTNIKPSYECTESAANWDPKNSAFYQVKEARSYFDVEDQWVDKSVEGFQEQDTSWLLEGEDDLIRERERRKAEDAQKEADIEAKMQMWLAQAAAKNQGQ